jgi:hypothetical protein
MGLQNSQGGNLVFLTISNGKIVRQVKEKTDSSVSRINKVGREVHEEFYDSLGGKIKEVLIKENDYGKFWIVKVKSDSQTYQLEINYSGGYATTFLKALPNVDLSIGVTLTPKLIIDGDKKRSVLFISQNGSGVKHYFTKDNPNGMPDLKKIKVKGKDTWDDSDRMEFLENYVKNNIFTKSDLQDTIEGEDVPF